jgi:hypothetical protein
MFLTQAKAEDESKSIRVALLAANGAQNPSPGGVDYKRIFINKGTEIFAALGQQSWRGRFTSCSRYGFRSSPAFDHGL